MVINGNFMSVEFSGFLRRKVDFSGNLKLMDFSGFSRLWFGVKAVYYKAFLFATGGSK